MDPHPKRRYEDKASDDDRTDVRRFLIALSACHVFGLFASITMYFFPSWFTLVLIALSAGSFVYVIYKVQKISQRMCDKRKDDDDDFSGQHPLPV